MQIFFKTLCFSIFFLFFTLSAQASTWPEAGFRFVVQGPNGFIASAQEVLGMEKEVQIIKYRHSNSDLFSTIKMPGIAKYGKVTLKRVIVENTGSFWDFERQIKMNTIARGTWFIRLLDANGNVMMQWQLNNAWPTKITGSDLKSDGSEVSIDTLTIAHEQLIVTGPDH